MLAREPIGSSDSIKHGLAPQFNHMSEAEIAVMYEQQPHSSYESVFIQFDPEPGHSLVQDLTEGSGQKIDWTPDVKNTSQFYLNPNMPAPEAGKIHDTAVACKMDTEQKLDHLETFYEEAQHRALDHLKQAATNLGYDKPDDVVGEFSPSAGVGKGEAAGALVGGGSFATFSAAGQGVYLAREIAEGSKGLSRDDKISLIKETVRLAQDAARPKDDLAAKSASGHADTRAGGPDEIDKGLASLSLAKMERMLTEPVTEQPEYKALAQVDSELAYVLDNNHPYFARHYGDGNLGPKMQSLAAQGNDMAMGIVQEAQVIQVDISPKPANNPRFDSGDVVLSGADLAGYVDVRAMDVPSVDLKSVQTAVDLTTTPGLAARASEAAHNYSMNAMRMG